MSGARVLVADDHPALATAGADVLTEAGYRPLGPATDGRKALALAVAEQPDLAIVDWRMPKLWGASLVAELRAALPDMPVLVYTAEADQEIARAALAAGAAALVLKEAPLVDLGRALDALQGGRNYVDPGVAATRAVAELTDRELDVLRLIAEGLSHDEVGAALGIGAETVRTHMRKACTRLGATTRTQAVATALRAGLIA
jgi:two-component system NarL family response regulator